MIINWYPGHMTAAKRMMAEQMKLIDVVLELRDARIPLSSANPDMEKLCGGKPRLILLNKADLADPAKTALWLSWFRQKGTQAIALTASKTSVRQILPAAEALCQGKIDALKQKGVSRSVRALVAGIPNSGKSTLINSLCGSSRAKTGDKPGVTKGRQWIKAGNIELLDTPGILWPKLDDQVSARFLACTGAINDEILDREELALALIGDLSTLYPGALEERYKISLGTTPLETFEALCRRRGFLLRGNEPDYGRGALVLLDEFRGGALGRITLEAPHD